MGVCIIGIGCYNVEVALIPQVIHHVDHGTHGTTTAIGAGAIVTLGVTAHTHAVLAAGSVATKDLDAYMIYQGNPAKPVRERVME